MLQRDKALKLELDVATSLNKDMTMRLAMTQRTIKQLAEKVATMEAAGESTKQAHDASLHEKVNYIQTRSTYSKLMPFSLHLGGSFDPARSEAEKY